MVRLTPLTTSGLPTAPGSPLRRAPEGVAHHDRRWPAEDFFFRAERAADGGRHAENGEEARRCPHGFHALRHLAGRVGRVFEIAPRQPRKRSVLAAPLLEPHGGDELGRLWPREVQLVHGHEAFALQVGKRLQQRGVDAENIALLAPIPSISVTTMVRATPRRWRRPRRAARSRSSICNASA